MGRQSCQVRQKNINCFVYWQKWLIFALKLCKKQEIRTMAKYRNKLTKIEISGFKSISTDCPLTLHLGDINLLLGANGAGKSNIVSFFRMLGFMMSGSFQMYVAQSGTNQKFLHYGSKITPCINASIEFSDGKNNDTYRFCLTHAVPNRLIINSEEIEWQCSSRPNTYKNQVVSNYNESGLIDSADRTCQIFRKFLSMCKVYQFSDSSISSPMRQASTVDSAHYLQSEANNLASFLYYLKNNFIESYNRIVDYVKTVMPQFGDFYLEPERGYITLKWRDNSPNDYVLSADQFSDGSIRFIALATLLLQPETTMPNVIVIDEPELGLHPYAIDQLTEMVRDASLHSQIILATQSASLIDGFDLDDITVVEQDEDKHCTIAQHLDNESFSEWLKNYSISELWNKNVFGGRPL